MQYEKWKFNMHVWVTQDYYKISKVTFPISSTSTGYETTYFIQQTHALSNFANLPILKYILQ